MPNRRTFYQDIPGASPEVRQKIFVELNRFAAKQGETPASTWSEGDSGSVKFSYSLSQLPVSRVTVYIKLNLDHIQVRVETTRLPRMLANAHFISLKAHFAAAFLIEPRDPT